MRVAVRRAHMKPALVLFAIGCSQPHIPTEAPADRCAAGALQAAESVVSLEVGDRTRRGLIWVPEGPGPHDVIVNLHEFRSNPRTQGQYSGWIDFARERNAYLIGPDGKYAMWNAGGCCSKARDRNIDDVRFLDAIVARLDEVGCTTGNVYATGIGNGGMMAHAWACTSDVPDAVVSIGGTLQLDECAKQRAIPMVHLHGRDDTWMPADGSGHHLPVSHTEAIWRARNGVTEEGRTHASGDVSCTEWWGESPVVSCSVAGEDSWPGAPDMKLESEIPLRDATRGTFAYVEAAWRGEGKRLDGSAVVKASKAGEATPPAKEVGGALDAAVTGEEAKN